MSRFDRLAAFLTPSEHRMLAFLAGWALLGAAGAVLPWSAGFSSDDSEPVSIPAEDPRAALYARSAALAAHLALARTPPEEPLNPNRASAHELDRLPGVGPRTALRWVEARSVGGPFFALRDLGRVEGLGPLRLAKLASHLRFPAAPGRRGGDSGGPEVLDLNRASASELMTLPGVGPVLAERIVLRRRTLGRLRTAADLDSVPGVGPALLRKLAGRVRFE